MAKYYSQTAPDWTGVQVGTISMMPKDDTGAYYAPDGWMECNGRTINPNEYLGLFKLFKIHTEVVLVVIFLTFLEILRYQILETDGLLVREDSDQTGLVLS